MEGEGHAVSLSQEHPADFSADGPGPSLRTEGVTKLIFDF